MQLGNLDFKVQLDGTYIAITARYAGRPFWVVRAILWDIPASGSGEWIHSGENLLQWSWTDAENSVLVEISTICHLLISVKNNGIVIASIGLCD